VSHVTILLDLSASCPSNSTTPVDSTGPQPEGNNSTVIGDTPSSAIGDGDPNAQQEIIRQVVPAVVVTASVVIAGVVVLVVLLKRRDKKKKSAVQIKVPLQRMNSRTISSRSLNRNTSKYGIERNTINSNPDKTWEPPAESEFAEVDKMPFEMSKKLDFNVGSNQFKVGQQYTDVITITARDKVMTLANQQVTQLLTLFIAEIIDISRSALRFPSTNDKETQDGVQSVFRNRQKRQTR
jgi:hypothetical protein